MSPSDCVLPVRQTLSHTHIHTFSAFESSITLSLFSASQALTSLVPNLKLSLFSSQSLSSLQHPYSLSLSLSLSLAHVFSGIVSPLLPLPPLLSQSVRSCMHASERGNVCERQREQGGGKGERRRESRVGRNGKRRGRVRISNRVKSHRASG